MESPTHVGNTRCHRTMRWRTSAHPHACGEYAVRSNTRLSAAGSSPRVWGIRCRIALVLHRDRFIPTRVGNTRSCASVWMIWAVHPHACGEYCSALSPQELENGSSPRVWGIPHCDEIEVRNCRFIPTRVGNTSRCRATSGARSVHPHACGEYEPPILLRPSYNGSSPRVWGIRDDQIAFQQVGRFIPTRVGNTLQEDARNNRLLAELQRATEPCVLQACSDDDKKGKELCKAAPSPRKTLPGRAVTLS